MGSIWHRRTVRLARALERNGVRLSGFPLLEDFTPGAKMNARSLFDSSPDGK